MLVAIEYWDRKVGTCKYKIVNVIAGATNSPVISFMVLGLLPSEYYLELRASLW